MDMTTAANLIATDAMAARVDEFDPLDIFHIPRAAERDLTD